MSFNELMFICFGSLGVVNLFAITFMLIDIKKLIKNFNNITNTKS